MSRLYGNNKDTNLEKVKDFLMIGLIVILKVIYLFFYSNIRKILLRDLEKRKNYPIIK